MWVQIGRWAALLIAIAVAVWHSYVLQRNLWIPDDAFISMRFAENFAEGRGIVYNEGERVEGYTNFLWVVLLGAGHFAGLDLVTLSQVLGIIFSAGTLFLLFFLSRILPSLPLQISALATLLLGTCGVFTSWMMAGMETPMVAFWVLLALLLHGRTREGTHHWVWAVATGLSCTLAAMSRPDAGLVFGIIMMDRFLLWLREGNRGILVAGAAFACSYGPYFLWRYWYYGHLLPNTFYVKVGGTMDQAFLGLDYTGGFMWACFFILAPAFAAFMISGRAFDRPALRTAAVALVGLHMAYVTCVGGDFMPSYRFYASILPVLCLLAAMSVVACRPRTMVTLAFALVALGYNVAMILDHPQIGDRAGKGNVSRVGKRVGLWLHEHAPKDALLATNTAGSIPFYSKLTTIDMLGLCDETIAHRNLPLGRGTIGHEKGDGRYVLSRKPDYIQFGSASGSDRASFLGDREIARSPEFRLDYVLKTYALPGGSQVRLYVRKREAGGKPIHAAAIEDIRPRTRMK